MFFVLYIFGKLSKPWKKKEKEISKPIHTFIDKKGKYAT